ncbi:MAG TPA: hypothetical protein PLD23_16620 [Armatimonadota bacterium]|nr:hypothetical protein [Armatimonadota bacterium]HQK95127.1 hypothetical protein [Armatimonadota bacterium]
MPISLPPVPKWEGLHPLVVHFPIALLIVAPLFVATGMLLWERTRAYAVAALILMVLGTAGAWVSVASGVAAMGLATVNAEGREVMARHQELAMLVRLAFSILTALYAAIVALPLFAKRLTPKVVVPVHLVFFVLYAGAVLVLAAQSHLGGRLVHEFGVQALM